MNLVRSVARLIHPGDPPGRPRGAYTVHPPRARVSPAPAVSGTVEIQGTELLTMRGRVIRVGGRALGVGYRLFGTDTWRDTP